ncbi:low-density lipoprotein receptor class A domain-containing protein 3-like [Lineus longissimus]|uniref:low-density lipoprotein receptor class A domain-containing protein 3-like n=1 Tax=Lineus longissimus TaxID=88925 RepID=UPI002B4C4E2D
MDPGRRNCNRHKPYKCANGQCTKGPANCHSSRHCKAYPLNPRRYQCPEGNCVRFDYHCIRPCGFEQTDTSSNTPVRHRYKYDYQCPHFPLKCGRSPSDCPSHCSYPDAYTCPVTGECKPNFHWCESCSEFRCDNGVCYQRNQKCDKLNDCGDWSDEKYCDGSENPELHPIATTRSPDGFLQPWSIVMISSGVILLMLATIYMILRRYGPICRRGRLLSNQNSPQIRSSCTYANDPSMCLWNNSVEGARLSYIPPQDSPTSFILSRAARSHFRETPANPPSYLDVMASEQYSPFPEDSYSPPSYSEAVLAAASDHRGVTEPSFKRLTPSMATTQTNYSPNPATETIV